MREGEDGSTGNRLPAGKIGACGVDYELLRQYTGNGQGLTLGSLRDALDREYVNVARIDASGVLSLLRRREIAAAIVMTRFRAEYTHLRTRIKAGDGTDEALWFDVEDRQSQVTPVGMLQNLTGGRTIIMDVERVEMMGAELFVSQAIAGRF